MKTELFVFSGTGNSLSCARELADRLGECEIRSIPAALAERLPAAAARIVGLIFPLYFMGPPRVVLEFIRRADLDSASYLFAVVTRGGSPGDAIHILRRELGRRSLRLDAGFYVTYWTNFIPRYRAPSEKRRSSLARRAGRRIREIAAFVGREGTAKGRELSLLDPLARWVWNRWLGKLKEWDRRFTVNERCTSCGICERICPVDNIRMEGLHPSWLRRCESCLACLHFCPVEAIQFGKRTRGKRRCRHPGIEAEDLMVLKRARCAHGA